MQSKSTFQPGFLLYTAASECALGGSRKDRETALGTAQRKNMFSCFLADDGRLPVFHQTIVTKKGGRAGGNGFGAAPLSCIARGKGVP